MNWLSLAKNLPLGRTSRCDCPSCGEGTNTNAAIINHTTRGYSLFCHACGHNPFENKGVQTLDELKRIKELNDDAARFTDTDVRLPKDFTTAIPLEGRLWLYGGGITPTVWERYNFGFSEHLQRVIIPVYQSGELVWYQARAVQKGQTPKYLNPTARKDGELFSSDGESSLAGKTVIVCEDILSAIRVGKVAKDHCNSSTGTSILGTKLCTRSIMRLGAAERVIGWFDNDNAGHKAARELYKSVGILTDVAIIRSERDPKRYSDETILQYLKGRL